MLNGKLIDLSSPKVMGILNVSPDSFFDGGKHVELDEIKKQANRMLNEGVDIIDIGAMSTRPNANIISQEEELKRLLPAVKCVRNEHPDIPISVDTYRSWVAKSVIQEVGDLIINDISGGSFDEHMFETVAQLGVPYILMHIHGNEQDMHATPAYENIIKDISKQLSVKVQKLISLGVKDIIIDPGFGFGKTLDDNYKILKHIDSFMIFELPLLAGMSRKSMFNKLLNISADESLAATISANTLALMGGANILRVHDVKEAVHCVKIFNKLKETE